MARKRAIVLNPKDNVAVAVENVEPGDQINLETIGAPVRTLLANEKIPFGFKIALAAIPRGGDVIKHGEIMGIATADITMGTQIHVHNVQGRRAQSDAAKGAKK
jgi:hypothetical protein